MRPHLFQIKTAGSVRVRQEFSGTVLPAAFLFGSLRTLTAAYLPLRMCYNTSTILVLHKNGREQPQSGRSMVHMVGHEGTREGGG